jgi:hypothetical protein
MLRRVTLPRIAAGLREYGDHLIGKPDDWPLDNARDSHCKLLRNTV